MNLIKYKIKEIRIKKAIKNNYLRHSNYCGGQVQRIVKNEEDAQILLNLINNVALYEYKPNLIIDAKKAFPQWIDIKDVERIVCRYGRSYHAYECATNFPDVNIELMEEIVLNDHIFRSLGWLHEYRLSFAKNIPGANIQKIQKSILEDGNMDLILAFAEQVDGADIAEIAYYFLERKDYRKLAKIQDKLNYHDKIDLITKIVDSGNSQLCGWAIKNLNTNDYYKDMLEFAMKAYEKVTIKGECEVIKYNELNKI